MSSATRPGRSPRTLIGLWLTAPYALYLIAVYGAPIVEGLRISFLNYVYAAPGASIPEPFVGLRNYRTALADPQLRQAFVNILEYLAVNVPLTVVLGLSLAAALARLTRKKTFLRPTLLHSVFFVPYITAGVAVIGVWYYLFSQGGLINRLLGTLAPDPSWLVNSKLAMIVIALEVTWKQLGFYILLYLAGILLIPRSLYEAATIDGAGTLRRFRSITVPGVRDITTLTITFSVIDGASLFTEPYLLTGGGPYGTSVSPALLIYQKGVEQDDPALGAAIGMLLTVFVLVVAGISRRLQRRLQTGGRS
ncbi:sugar ABC transporter permease [Catenulispora yoronensis]|uniref:Sugar ABC transporter permease n=1 Tax=Catenulispora yoronensis TaxID=450799 RepID=A0ABN2V5Z3_9ACTN